MFAVSINIEFSSNDATKDIPYNTLINFVVLVSIRNHFFQSRCFIPFVFIIFTFWLIFLFFDDLISLWHIYVFQLFMETIQDETHKFRWISLHMIRIKLIEFLVKYLLCINHISLVGNFFTFQIYFWVEISTQFNKFWEENFAIR